MGTYRLDMTILALIFKSTTTHNNVEGVRGVARLYTENRIKIWVFSETVQYIGGTNFPSTSTQSENIFVVVLVVLLDKNTLMHKRWYQEN